MPTRANMFTGISEQHFGPAYIVENRGNEDRNCVPISRVFDCFRNMRTPNIRADCMAQTDRNCVPISSVFDHFRIMRTTNIRADCMAQTVIRKRSLSTTGLPYACVDWRETPNVVIATVDVGRNVRRCLTGASSDVYVNARSLVRPSDDHLLAPGIIKNHDTLDGTIVPISDVFGRFRNMNTGEFRSFKAKLPHNVIDYKTQYPMPTGDVLLHLGFSYIPHNIACRLPSTTLNHAYLRLDLKDGVIRPATISFSNIIRETSHHNHRFAEYLRDNTKSVLNEDDTTSYMDLGDCDQQCRHCGCLFWYNERLKGDHSNRQAEYYLCYGGGQIYMPPTPAPPAFIQQLLENNHFMEYIRAYNQMFSMTSFGAKINDLDKVTNRMQHFGGLGEGTLNPEIKQGLIHVLDEHNGLVRLFRTARDRCNAGEIPGFKIRLYNMGNIRGYELPASDLLGGIVNTVYTRKVTTVRVKKVCTVRIIREKDFRSVLAAVREKPGFYPELQLKPRDGRGRGKRVTMNAYYKYQLHPRVKELGFSSGVEGCFSNTGDCEGIAAGSKIMLPSTSIGGPCAIYNRVSKKRVTELSKGYKLVTELLMHGPYGAANLGALCMQEGSCNKHFPKKYNNTTFFDTNGHTQYRRRDTWVHVMKGESKLDCCNVVSYSRALCLAFEAHINVEYCGWKFMWYPNSKQWQRRHIRTKKSLGRLTYVHPSSGDLFYFRKLLCHQKGCRSPIEVRTVNVQILPTYRAACEALGLLGDDKEWDIALQESVASATKSMTDFGLELPPQHLLKDLENKLLMEEKNYKRDLLREDAAQSVLKLNHE
ncbi:hypothetical protein Tco_0469488 [Tanacetum coccineum]